MFIHKPIRKCPYANRCSGYLGGYTCIDDHHVNCARYKLLQEMNDCYDKMEIEKILRGLNKK